ncbi:MAG TPA: phosphate ABC transporter permease PstA [Candidatus Limnocylindrales bacterium]
MSTSVDEFVPVTGREVPARHDAGAGSDRPRTNVPAPGQEATAPEPLRLGRSRDDSMAIVGAAGSALGVVLLLSAVLHVLPPAWAPVALFCWFVGIYAVLVLLREPWQAVRDRFWTVILCAAGAVVVASLGLVIVYVLTSGNKVFNQMFDPNSGQNLFQRLHFFTQDMSRVGPLDGLNKGGILYALIGTLIQIGIALLITVPLGLTTAVFLGEVGGRFAKVVRTVVEAMTALPSVVAGLFIYAMIIMRVTHENTGFAASLAISVLMLPIMIRSADVVLRLVPGNLREAGLALGAGQWSTVWRVVLPTVRSGLMTAVILATAHGIGETAPVLLTSGVTTFVNTDPFHGSMTSLPLAALEFAESPQPDMKARGFATAAFLLLLVLVLFGIARLIGGGGPGGRRGSARRAHRSRSTYQRVAATVARTRPAWPATAITPEEPQ